MRRLTSTLALATVLALSSGVAAQTDAPTTGTNLYHVDLESGELTSLGIIGTGQTVVAFAIDTTGAFPLTGWGITDAGTVLTFNATLPGAVGSELALTGIPDGDWLVGIDQRPATGQLIGPFRLGHRLLDRSRHRRNLADWRRHRSHDRVGTHRL